MSHPFLNMRNVKFSLHEVVKADALADTPLFSGYTVKSMDMVLDAAHDFAKKALHPIFEEMDRNPPYLEDGAVRVHPNVKKILATLGEDGWIAAGFPEEWGGENMPAVLLHACSYIFAAANYSASVYAGLSMGAAKLLENFADDSLTTTYIPKLLSGKWQGTMALTEPNAGTSLGDLVTKATPVADGSYRISGQKTFISAGDHDSVENVVHLLLARIDGAHPGVKGISLFVVPKLRVAEGNALVSNDVTVTQVFHKLGYRGAPITELSFGEKGDCHGYLVGDAGKGLAYMFQMMNGARLEVGMGATAIATAAYQAALNYTKVRKQGRSVMDKGSASQIPIIGHADIKRMLLFQRSVSEGALSLILMCSYYEDRIRVAPEGEAHDLHLLLELLTPVAKTYPSEMGILATSQAIQCFGGYGYCEDFPVEQHFRDMRIHPIHEGTTGIQGMDLLGRKVAMENGKALMLLSQEITRTIKFATHYPELVDMAGLLDKAFQGVVTTTQTLGALAMEKGPEAFLADSTLYLEMFGHAVIGWQWFLQAGTAVTALKKEGLKKTDQAFYEGKLQVCRYFYRYELPKVIYLADILTNGTAPALTTVPEHLS